MAEQIPDRHLEPRLPARAPRELQDAARQALPLDRSLSAALVAFLQALRSDPERTLALLEEHWPPEKKGRPKAKPQDAPE